MKRYISIALVIFMLLTNIYLVLRVSGNNMTITSYDGGISQRNGVGQFESFWTKYVGGSSSNISAGDYNKAKDDNNFSITVLFILDIVIIGGLVYLNRTPKPTPTPKDRDEDLRLPRRRRYR
ncbi:MAG: hypothetical protein K6G55_04105 [Selenomonadaceae bacterium]|nr:hypothetical protein [Selenomonadaceae bacterium]